MHEYNTMVQDPKNPWNFVKNDPDVKRKEHETKLKEYEV